MIELTEKINYQFNNIELLKKALTHRSKGEPHNERLEFLGDSVVNFVVAEALYYQFPEATEGELSRWRATLVNRDALAQLARDFQLSDYLILGQGELRSGGSERQSILSCTMEAIIGAIYLDADFEIARTKILEWYKQSLKSLSSAASHKDAKTVLQEYLQAKHVELPIYQVEKIEGQAHQQQFIMSCTVKSYDLQTIGEGSSRKRAEQSAAQLMLVLLAEKGL